jgi:acid stress-induced BolA-like protein IbaG/YrbA
MDDLEQAIEEALAADLPGVEVRFDPYPGFGKLHGAVVWDGFQNQLQMERQRQVWDVLRPVLTDEQRLATGFLLTVTPAEINAMQEVAA